VTGWDLMSWAAVAALGPGALIIFLAFLRDLRALLGPRKKPERDDVGL
jgi:hypothetical protein